MVDTATLALFPSGAGAGELILLFALVLVLFGPRKLPQIARTMGKILSDIRRASQDFRDQVMHIDDDEHIPSSLNIDSDVLESLPDDAESEDDHDDAVIDDSDLFDEDLEISDLHDVKEESVSMTPDTETKDG